MTEHGDGILHSGGFIYLSIDMRLLAQSLQCLMLTTVSS